MTRFVFLPSLLLLALTLPGLTLCAAPPADLLTVAERSQYTRTARHAEVLELVDRLDQRSEQLRRFDMGRTVEDRPLPVMVAARPMVDSPQALADDPRLAVVILANIHSGECAGKEAALMLLREIALDPKHPLLDQLILLVVPNYNADGNERMGAEHRPGQIGPEVMGTRENAQGLDLNRDFVKLEAPETRALARLLTDWNPHSLIDLHTTNGSRHRYQLTYDIPHNPAAPERVRHFLRDQMMPEVTRRLKSNGVQTFFYGNFNEEHTRWSTYGHQPRYSTEYLGLRGRLGILSEAYSYIPYRDRIEATAKFVRQCLDYLAEHPDQVRAAVAPHDYPPTVPLISKLIALPGKTKIQGFDQRGKGKQPQDYDVDFYGRYDATLTTPRPRAYLIPNDQSRVVDRLKMHGIQIEQLTRDAKVKVGVEQVKTISRAGSSFQGHRLVTIKSVGREEQQLVPAKTYLVRTDQPLGTLAAYLLEPQSDDGLATWNFLDGTLARDRDFPVLRLLDDTPLDTKEVTNVEPAQQLTLDQIYGPTGRVSIGGGFPLSLRWLGDSASYLNRQGAEWQVIDAETGAARSFRDADVMARALAALPAVSTSDAQSLSRSLHQLSPDGKATLISFANDLFYYRFGEQQALRLTHTAAPERYATFSPDGQLVAFVREHNLYLVEVQTGRERALSSAGSADLLHGELDWVYHEELYGRTRKGFWWSPDSSRLALLRLDQTPVHKFAVPDHIPYRQSVESTRYPKAGDPLPRVALGIVRAAGGEVTWIDDYEYSSAERLIVRVSWTPNSRRVVYQVQNRSQTWLDLRTVSAAGTDRKRLLREASDAWVNVIDHPYWLPDESFLWLSEREGNRHLYRIKKDGVTALTLGDWEVRSIDGYDSDKGWIYFSGWKERPTESQAFRVRLDGSSLQQLTSGGSHRLRYDKGFRFALDYASAVHRPIYVNLLRSDGKRVRSIAPNLDDHLAYYQLNEPEFIRVPTPDGQTLEAMLIKPPDFDPAKRYPVLCYVYGGPQAPTVRDRWNGSTYLWHQMLAQRGYCIWLCDNRPSSLGGMKYTATIRGRLGQNELKDIETGLDWLRKQPWVDPQRFGIWGWSYGGYMTSYALTHSKSFKVGIAGAPVTDWRNYDAIYTERYLGLPQDNPEGYRRGSVVDAASKLHGRLLLIHGSTDDNVHLSNTLQLVYRLQQAGKQFDLMIYPRNRHGISQPQQSRHMRDLMTRFILDRL